MENIVTFNRIKVHCVLSGLSLRTVGLKHSTNADLIAARDMVVQLGHKPKRSHNALFVQLYELIRDNKQEAFELGSSVRRSYERLSSLHGNK
jgi:hypothetical protein